MADVRKSFDGLSGLVTNELNMEMESGDVFIFINRRQTHIKLLQWEGDGYGMYYKRLEEGTFELPAGFMEKGHIVKFQVNNSRLFYTESI